MKAKLLLKARPTPTQLADRLRAVDGRYPDGLELYLAAADLASADRVDAIVERVTHADVPQGFVWLIEGPVDSLDGADFDITRLSEADLLVLERLAQLANKIEAKAVNIHVISPSPDLGRLTLDCRAALLERAVPSARAVTSARPAPDGAPASGTAGAGGARLAAPRPATPRVRGRRASTPPARRTPQFRCSRQRKRRLLQTVHHSMRNC